MDGFVLPGCDLPETNVLRTILSESRCFSLGISRGLRTGLPVAQDMIGLIADCDFIHGSTGESVISASWRRLVLSRQTKVGFTVVIALIYLSILNIIN